MRALWLVVGSLVLFHSASLSTLLAEGVPEAFVQRYREIKNQPNATADDEAVQRSYGLTALYLQEATPYLELLAGLGRMLSVHYDNRHRRDVPTGSTGTLMINFRVDSAYNQVLRTRKALLDSLYQLNFEKAQRVCGLDLPVKIEKLKLAMDVCDLPSESVRIPLSPQDFFSSMDRLLAYRPIGFVQKLGRCVLGILESARLRKPRA